MQLHYYYYPVFLLLRLRIVVCDYLFCTFLSHTSALVAFFFQNEYSYIRTNEINLRFSAKGEYTASAMKSEEVKAIINPIYEQAMKEYQAKNLEKALDALHSNAVFVHKGVDVSYGKKAVAEKLQKLTEEYGDVKFEKVNQTYCGCECCLCTSYEWKVDSSKKGKVKATIFQIYKKDGGKWKTYHHEMEIHDK